MLFTAACFAGCLFYSATFPGSGQRSPVRLVHPHKPLAPECVVLRIPDFGALHRRTRRPCPFEHIKRATYDVALHFFIPRLAAGIAERKVYKQKTRDAAFFNDVSTGADNNGWNSRGFQMSCNQTHGLVADRSQRDENRDINVILAHPTFDLRCVLLFVQTLAVICRRAIESLAHRSNSTFLNPFVQPRQW